MKIIRLICLVLAINGLFSEISIAQRRLEKVYVLNEGGFDAGTATITTIYMSGGKPATLQHNSYALANGGLPLGDVLYSSAQVGDELWLVINNSHRIVRVNPSNLQRMGNINLPGGSSPRNLVLPGNGKVYVTLLFSNAVGVIDLGSKSLVTTISVGANPEGIVYDGKYLYVANSGLGSGNTVSVIDPASDKVISTITVADNPIAMALDGNGVVWVLCSGAYNDFMDPNDDTPGTLVSIDPVGLKAKESVVVGGHPSRLALLRRLGKLLFLTEQGVASFDYRTSTLDPELFVTGNYYSLGVSDDADESVVMVGDAKNFIQAGTVEWFDLNGVKQYSFAAGIIPTNFQFVGALATTIEDDREVPTVFGLEPAFPNPFNPTTTIPFRLYETGRVRIDVVDATGRQIRRLVDGDYPSGAHEIQFDATDLPSGVYMIRMMQGQLSSVRKVTLLK